MTVTLLATARQRGRATGERLRGLRRRLTSRSEVKGAQRPAGATNPRRMTAVSVTVE